MMKKFTKKLMRLALFAGLLIAMQNVYAQQLVTGTVSSETKEGMPGVNVVVKGTTTGTSTDANGKFSLQVPGPEAVLVFSFVGYLSEEISVGARTQIDINLTPDIASLQEVVVIGYGTQRKEDVTGAVVSVKSKDFLVGKIQDATDLVKGKVAGLVITKSSGDPNASSNIVLRGITTIQGNVNPLILINGVPGDITSVAPENVESVDVLKDASAAAIYGTRGANGVILIKTKGGKRDVPVTVNYTGYASFADFYKQADFMGPAEVRRGLTNLPMGDWDTDWVKAITQKGFMHNHSVTIDGGSKNSAYSGNVS
jgi:TonB-dependent SusC/RagA subfamily outer membrane receptor